MKLFAWLLFPFALLYSWIMQLRNHQFDNGSRRISHFDRVIISVGNLSVGGTGKTPLIEYLIQLLKTSNKIATVSRGYGRRSRGFRIANESDDAKAIGDEPLQLYKKYGDEVIVSVGEERILAIPSVLLDIPETDLFLLDDAFQHRKIGRDFDILLSDYDKPFYEDYVLPMGRLREGREGAKRADCIIITKCPMLDESEKSEIRLKISKYSPETPIYFSRINYLDPLNVFSANDRFFSNNIVLISGLADSSKFVAYAKSKYIVEDHFEYSDHHNFRKLDFDRMLNRIDNLGEELVILTTEKDMVRILNFKEHPLFKKAPIFYVPIAFTIDDKSSFDEMLLKTIEEKKNQN